MGENLNRGSGPYKVKGALPDKLCKGKALHMYTHTHTHAKFCQLIMLSSRGFFFKSSVKVDQLIKKSLFLL